MDEYSQGEIVSAYGLAQNWWLRILRGLGAVGAGLAILLWSNLLVVLFGVYVLADGILAVIAGLTRYHGSRPWWLLLIEGLLGLGAGVLTLLAPSLSVIGLYLIAAWALTTGMVKIVAAIRLRKDIENEGVLALSGILSIGFGMLLVIWPTVNAPVLGWLIGSYTLASGLMLVGFGLRLWNWQWSTRLMTLQPVRIEIGHPLYKSQKK